MKELAAQVLGKRKCRQKLPSWFRADGIYYPPLLALEQCSSEETAAYKASLTGGRQLADLTGGLGVDTYYFSRKFSKVLHVEQSEELSAIAAHNLAVLGAKNVRFYRGDGLGILQGETWSPGGTPERNGPDCIYLDPSRRDAAGKKVFRPTDYQPDFLSHLEQLLSAAPLVMIKTSPLLDLRAGIEMFRYVRAVHVVAVRNECKELVWMLSRPAESRTEPAIPDGSNSVDPEIVCVNIRGTGDGNPDIRARTDKPLIESPRTDGLNFNIDRFGFSLAAEAALPAAAVSFPCNYLYEPNAAILKAGAFKTLGDRFGLAKLQAHSHLYTGEEPLADFPGRIFRILECLTAREFGKKFKGGKLHLATRNFPGNADLLKRKFRITEGGELYAFFTTLKDHSHAVILCEKDRQPVE